MINAGIQIRRELSVKLKRGGEVAGDGYENGEGRAK